MSAYLIVNVDVKNAAAYEEYKAKVPALIGKHGGEYAARGGECIVIEGNWRPKRMVLLRFPDLAAVKRFLADPEYQPLIELRRRVAESEIVAVEGI
jgi:uncharacterized protein (DUF1330 family)